jgi:hypothetical protein
VLWGQQDEEADEGLFEELEELLELEEETEEQYELPAEFNRL